MNSEACKLAQVNVALLYPLRSSVLRPGLPLASCFFDGDDLVDTRHFALYDGDVIVAIASTLNRSFDEGNDAWQLRGMATAPGRQGQGMGSILLQGVLDVSARHVGELWCNAREEAVPFYRRHAFECISDRFLIEGVGPHFMMRRAFKHGPLPTNR